MKRRFSSQLGLTVIGLFLVFLPVRAGSKYSAKELDQLDKLGAFPTDFKLAVHDYVNVKKGLVETAREEKKLRSEVPGLEKQALTDQTKVDALQLVLADYDHTDDSDFVVLQAKMNDSGAKPKDQLLLAQTYVWSYPMSPHQPQAQIYLQQVQKVIADELQAEKDAAAAKAAAWALLLQRVQNRDLRLDEWKDFLNNMTQDDVVKYMGPATRQVGYYWIYEGPWALEPSSNQKVGLELNFNGGRVIGVAGMASATAVNSSE